MRWFPAAMAAVSLFLAVKNATWGYDNSRDQQFRILCEISLTIVLTYGAITWKN